VPSNPRETADLCFSAVQTAEQLAAVATLAQVIWREHYVPLIGAAQVEYMLAESWNPRAMREQMQRGDEYFSISRGSELLGYLAVRAEVVERSLFISKLYLQRASRGAGLGRRALQFIESLARARELQLLWLTVNQRNPAVQVYERCGFAITASVRIDIGNGFVLDDFRMEKHLGATAERISTHESAIS
jgi:diamine N-acetyltransferase